MVPVIIENVAAAAAGNKKGGKAKNGVCIFNNKFYLWKVARD